ncbi:hypothetical protein GN958_ATG04246 [Phytophthora infestans]|uniref:Uncharacterized protein n=1 Tax=Phytophthora infestans TaxID=4787 RepID=A0A8S9V5B1_PHYIN|nr:hypothetical protein GN958_ATG04246 [Phytophthora infestans]
MTVLLSKKFLKEKFLSVLIEVSLASPTVIVTIWMALYVSVLLTTYQVHASFSFVVAGLASRV